MSNDSLEELDFKEFYREISDWVEDESSWSPVTRYIGEVPNDRLREAMENYEEYSKQFDDLTYNTEVEVHFSDILDFWEEMKE